MGKSPRTGLQEMPAAKACRVLQLHCAAGRRRMRHCHSGDRSGGDDGRTGNCSGQQIGGTFTTDGRAINLQQRMALWKQFQDQPVRGLLTATCPDCQAVRRLSRIDFRMKPC